MKVAITLRVMSQGSVTRSVTATFTAFHCKAASDILFGPDQVLQTSQHATPGVVSRGERQPQVSGHLLGRLTIDRHSPEGLPGGFAEVLPDRVTILAQIAEKADEVDVVRARSALERAEQRLTRPQTEMDFERARIALLKSLIRLQVSERKRTRV